MLIRYLSNKHSAEQEQSVKSLSKIKIKETIQNKLFSTYQINGAQVLVLK